MAKGAGCCTRGDGLDEEAVKNEEGEAAAAAAATERGSCAAVWGGLLLLWPDVRYDKLGIQCVFLIQ